MKPHLLAAAMAFLLPVAAARSAHADDSTYKNVVGAISDTYGSFQAAQFVGEEGLKILFGIGASDEVSSAVTELQGFMRNYRDQDLVNRVTGDISLFHMIASDYQNGLTDDLESHFIAQSLGDLAQLTGDIQTGTMDDAYMLGPAFNLLTITYVAALKAFGIENPANAYPDDVLDS